MLDSNWTLVLLIVCAGYEFFVFKQKTAYEMRISDWSSDVCSSDLLRVLSLEHKLGINASPTCVMSYGESSGALAYLVGEENRGVEYMFTMMNNARLSVGVQGLAIAERAYQQARAFAEARVQSRAAGAGKEAVPIIRHPDVRRMLKHGRAHV